MLRYSGKTTSLFQPGGILYQYGYASTLISASAANA